MMLAQRCQIAMLLCMRTTIRIDDRLFAELKKLAAVEGRTLAAVIEDALREALSRRERQFSSAPFSLPTFGAAGLASGLTVETMRDAIDQEDEERFRRILEENS